MTAMYTNRVDLVNMIHVCSPCDKAPMDDMGDRLRAARILRGFKSARSAAMRFGWTVSTYNAHENGQNEFGPEIASMYARAFGVSRGWLLTGEGPAPDQQFDTQSNQTAAVPDSLLGASAQEPAVEQLTPASVYFAVPNAEIQAGPALMPAKALLPHDIPELGVTVGGSGDDDSVFELNGSTADYHPRPPGLSRRPNVFVLRVSNSSMSPRFEDGDLEYIELKNPSVGEYVVVELKPESDDGAGRSYIKRLVKADARKIVVEQFNPPGFMEFGRHEILRLFRVITSKRELFG